MKHSYTELINLYVRDDKDKQKVFDRNGVYLPMKKIGKNNPKAEQIEADNTMRTKWNQTVDRALVSGVSEEQIMEVKSKEIGQKAKSSFERLGSRPELFKGIIVTAISVLELLIDKIFKSQGDRSPSEEMFLQMPKKSSLASKYHRLISIHQQLQKENHMIYELEKELGRLEKELANTKGAFKGKQRKQLQEQIEGKKTQLENMKSYLPKIVQKYGYATVKEFMNEYRQAKAEYGDYKKTATEWEALTGCKVEPESVNAKIRKLKKDAEELMNRQTKEHHRQDRGGR